MNYSIIIPQNFDNFPGKERPNTIIIFSKEGGRQGRARNIALPHAGMDTEHVRQEIAKREARKAQSLAPTHRYIAFYVSQSVL